MDSAKDKSSEVQRQPKEDNTKKSKTYEKGGTAGIEGSLYEIKLLALFLVKEANKGSSFRLATQMKEAGKFDDLVFIYTTPDGQEKSLLLQAKHRLDISEKIKEEELLTQSDTDFSLVKYFFSYRDILKKESFETIEEVIVYTNIDFSDTAKTYVESLNNDIWNLKDEPGFEKSVRYRFKKDIILNKLKRQLENYQPTRLTIKLIDNILTKEGIRKPQPGSIFEPYEVILSQEVINTKNKQFRFHSKFITGESLDAETKEFRDIFEKVLKDKSHKFREVVKNTIKETEEKLQKEKHDSKQTKLQEFINHFQPKIIDQNSEFNLEDLDKYVKNVPLTLAKNFGKVKGGNNGNANWPQDTVPNDNIKDFLDHLVFAVNQPNESELDNIIECEISKDIKFKYLTSDLVAEYIQRRMLEWFKETIGKDKGRFLTPDEGKVFLEEITQKVNTLITIGPSIEYCVKLKETGIKFNKEGKNGLIALNNFLMQKQISHLIALEEPY